MRADLAPFAVSAALALAGLGVLWAIGMGPRGGRATLASLGLAYLTGFAVVPVALIALLTVGVPLTLVTFAIVVLACVAAGAFAWSRREPGTAPVPLRDLDRTTAWIVGGFAVALAVYGVVGLRTMVTLPLDQWDAWSMWTRKAQMLFEYESLIETVFDGPSYGFSHLDYPLLFPVWQTLHFRAVGSFDTQAMLGQLWLLLPAFAWAVAYLVRDHIRALVWAPILLALVVAQGVWAHLITGYADIPVALLAFVAALSVGLWLVHGNRAHLALGVVMLVGTANVKNEGLMMAAAILLTAGAIALARRADVKAFALACAGFAVGVLPWKLWTAAHDIESYLPISKGLDPGYLLDRTERIRPTIRAINGHLANQDQWLYVIPLAALVIVSCLVFGVARRAAAFYLGSATIVWALTVWSYWISPLDLRWHLDTSVDRVIAGFILICAAAVLHLTGLLAARFYAPAEPGRPARSADSSPG